MTRSRVLTTIICAAFCLTLVSSVRADSDNNHGEMLLEKLIFAENHGLIAFEKNRAPGYLYAAHFENNNGKHLGFSVAANKGVTLGIVAPPQAATVTQNPEPTAMVLLGTGLAAIGGIARRVNRRRKL